MSVLLFVAGLVVGLLVGVVALVLIAAAFYRAVAEAIMRGIGW